jgi:hypothetical protein
MANNQQLLRELEAALASQAALKQQRADMIHTVATSPSKKKKIPAPAPRPQPPKKQGPPRLQQQQLIPAGRHSAHGAQQKSKPSSSRTTIPAFRPPSPTDSQDTVGREIDAAITKSVANMLPNPVGPLQQQQQQQERAVTPTFLTAKRRNMHCELDEPGYGVPFPHRKQKGFFAKLFSFACFAPPQTRGSPPSPFLLRTPTRPRPPSAKVTPPTLKLTSEMAPFRQSLASLKPGLAAAALAADDDAGSGGAGGGTSVSVITLSEHQPLTSGGGGSPPTPQFGTMNLNNLQFPPRNHDTWLTQGDHNLNGAAATTPQHEQLHSEASFESLEAELSDNEDNGGAMMTPGGVEMYRRTPVAGADGRPLVQKRRQVVQQQQEVEVELREIEALEQKWQQMQSSRMRNAEASHAKQLQAALIQALAVPLPPQAGQMMGSRQNSSGGNGGGGGAKQTQVTLAALMDPNNNNINRQREKQGRYYDDIRSAPVSPQKLGGATSKAPQIAAVPAAAPVLPLQDHQQQQHRRPQVKSAPTSRAVSPLKQPSIKPRMTKAASARSEATQRLLETRRKREMAHLANLQPRAAKRKEEAMLNHQLSRGSSLNSDKSDERIQVKRPRSAQNEPFAINEKNATAAADGYQLPAAGTRAPTATITENNQKQATNNTLSAASLIVPDTTIAATSTNNDLETSSIPVPPRSPGFYQMLERLALGMSVDMARVEEEKKPKKTTFAPMEASLVEIGVAEEENKMKKSIEDDGGDFVFNPNALFSGNIGKAEMSPLVNIAAQKLVSLSDAVVARSASGSVATAEEVKMMEEEIPRPPPPAAAAVVADGGIAVDASSGTLLGQLMELERSLTLNDLAALRHAIRREGSEAEAWTDDV